jgi:SAM-dependent methyltransferase
MQFTGERWIPGLVEQRIEDDHVQRYHFATRYSSGQRILDIACGAGAGANLLLTKGQARQVEGVDICPDAIAHAQATYVHPQLSFKVGAIEDYSTTEPWDMITCFETIEHVADDRLVLGVLKKALKPGGLLLISSPNRPITSPEAITIDHKPTNSFHVREFTPGELKGRLQAVGFSGIQSYGQRLRYYSRSRVLAKVIHLSSHLVGGTNPDRDSSPEVRPFWLRTPRYFVLAARG